MNDDLKSLALAAVASKHWRWVPGMLCIHEEWRTGLGLKPWDARILQVDCDYDPPALDVAWSWNESDGGIHPRGVLPVLTDDATAGCVERLACDVWQADQIHIRIPIAPDMAGPRAYWSARSYRGHRHGGGVVRGSHLRLRCLIAALGGAP